MNNNPHVNSLIDKLFNSFPELEKCAFFYHNLSDNYFITIEDKNILQSDEFIDFYCDSIANWNHNFTFTISHNDEMVFDIEDFKIIERN